MDIHKFRFTTEVECGVCGKFLTINDLSVKGDVVSIKILPCAKCLQDAKGEASFDGNIKVRV